MQEPATKPRISSVVVLGGGLVLVSAALLAPWASGQPSPLWLPPADEANGGATSSQAAAEPGDAGAAGAAAEAGVGAATEPGGSPTAVPQSQATGPRIASLPNRPADVEQQQLQHYPLDSSNREIFIAWQEAASQRTDLRVAIDAQKSQAIVRATPAVHEQIRRQLAAKSDGSENQLRAQSSAAGGAQPAARGAALDDGQPLVLRNISAEALRTRLANLLLQPLPARSDPSGQWHTFSVGNSPASTVTIGVNLHSREVRLEGSPEVIKGWRSVVRALDNPQTEKGYFALPDGNITDVVAVRPDELFFVRRAIGALELGGVAAQSTAALATMLFQAQPGGAPAGGQPGAGALPGGAVQPAPGGLGQGVIGTDIPGVSQALQQAEASGLIGQVQIQFIEGANIVIIIGREQDVQRVVQIIERIEALTKETTPAVEIHELQHVNSESMAALLTRVYDAMFAGRLGALNVTALGKPNALLLVGPAANVQTAIEKIIIPLDQPVTPQTRFEVFRLKHVSAANAKTLVDGFLRQDATGATQPPPVDPLLPALTPRATVIADATTNSLVVSASQRDMADITELLRRVDTVPDQVFTVRVFPLRNVIATTLADALTTAIAQPADATIVGNHILQIIPIGEGEAVLRSGILNGVSFTAEANSNSLIVKAHEETMPLIAKLIERLDVTPEASAELKVFPIKNGDSVALTTMLQTLFAATATADAAAPGLSEGGLVRLQITNDPRTNSIIVAGSREDLWIVEAILTQLDVADIRQRETRVIRLSNAFAVNVAPALQTLILQQQTIDQQTGVVPSIFDVYQRGVIVVAEQVTNHLIISAAPEQWRKIEEIIEQLDKRPPMVQVQVLIAEVRLGDTDEFGIEFGLQDSLLFDRSNLSSFDTITTTTTEPSAAGGSVQTQTQTIINAVGEPGFNFNNPNLPLGNNLSTAALAAASHVATQGLSNFGVNRINNDLGFSGFVFSASSQSVSVLLRALQEKRRLEILSRPILTAVDAQVAALQVGQEVPLISSTSFTEFGQVNTVTPTQVGLIISVQPLISPDGIVSMVVSAEKSEVGPEAEGIPISITTGGQVLRSPRIDRTIAETTVSAADGQTIVLSGLLTTRKSDVHRRVPLLAEIPLLGDLFRYDSVAEERRELLIIMTPKIIDDEKDAEQIKRVESSRMSWILGDVISLNGHSGLRSRCDEWYEGEMDSVYPNYIPQEGELMPLQNGVVPHGPSLYDPNAPTPMQVIPGPMGLQQPGLNHSSMNGRVPATAGQTAAAAPKRLPNTQ
jgi:type II secretion system protein D